jgi:hypothetical protein
MNNEQFDSPFSAMLTRSKNRTLDDIMDAIVTALKERGEDGHGENGLEGYMFMMARFDAKRFAFFLERALRLLINGKHVPMADKPWKLGVAYARMLAALREREESQKGVRPKGTRDLTEAVINAATRHGSDGYGENGLAGYVVQLERTDPKFFDRLIGLAQLWHAMRPKQPEESIYPTSEEELNATMRALGMDVEGD